MTTLFRNLPDIGGSALPNPVSPIVAARGAGKDVPGFDASGGRSVPAEPRVRRTRQFAPGERHSHLLPRRP